MQILKQPIEDNEYYINEFAASLANRAHNCHEFHCLRNNYYFPSDASAVFTTFGLFAKRVLLRFFYGEHEEYTLTQTIDMANEIAYLSGRGRDKYEHGDVYRDLLCGWCWAFVKGFTNVAKKSEEIRLAKNLWTRCVDGSASNLFHDREFLIEKPDIHDSWSPNDYGVIEKWRPLEDDQSHYYLYKVFRSEFEARIFIADLVMKINGMSWYNHFKKAIDDITDAMAEVYSPERKSVWDEIQRCKAANEQNDKPQAQSRQRVYIMHFKDGINKIGVSTNIESRARSKEKESGRIISEICATDFIDNAYRVESLCHNALKKYRTAGEFFNCSYEEAKAVLQNYSPITVRLSF